METTNKEFITNIQGIKRKESKENTIEIHKYTKAESKKIRKEKRTKTIRKQ